MNQYVFKLSFRGFDPCAFVTVQVDNEKQAEMLVEKLIDSEIVNCELMK